ncbi:N-acyl-D-amino-acid deacylase family protein [Sphingobacterium faecale]|uniref:Amidohydrolase family protein n=1 Tax=Sphingobacterium faecale TaxID=2803775 RepID=A0ABS1QYP9_9SPHI|nr:amidohydrolase family protein [Sphingobacterium faecale]MBL1407429.1 amidohydrolase family protein [Sphingobacterium faecale]
MKKVILALGLLCPGILAAQQEVFDYFIKNATVYDGTGAAGAKRSVGIRNDKVAYVGLDTLMEAKHTIDGTGYVLSPGFIDPHTHADRWLKDDNTKYLYPWIAQGVTTVFVGSDGFGTYEINKEFNLYEQKGMGANVAAFVGFGPIRSRVLGNDVVQPDKADLEEMKLLVEQGMQEGALGLSTGLLYVPQIWSETPEIIELSKVAAKYGGIYDTHMRSESGNIINSVREVISIGQTAALPVHISHIKVSGMDNWGRSTEVIDLINKERAAGLDITANQYPFVASLTGLKNGLLPKWALAGGNAKMVNRLSDPNDLKKIKTFLKKRTDEQNKRVVISSLDKKIQHLNGKSLYDLCQEWKMPIEEVGVKLLKEHPAVSGMSFSMDEQDIISFSKEPWVMTGSDGGGFHPRTYATFTQIVENFCMAKEIFPLEWAIHRATGMTAKKFKIPSRGEIKEGYYADIILFKPEEVKAHSDLVNIDYLSEGMRYVFVNGEPVIAERDFTKELPGKTIKKAQ